MSKREVKRIDGFEKELLSESERVELWISKYWLKVAVVSLIVVVIGVVIYAVKQSSEKAELAAQQELFSASKEKLAAAIAAHPDAPGVELAMLRQAGFLQEDKKYDEAAEMLKKLAASNADILIRQIAALNAAAALEAAGKIADAAAAYATAVDFNDFSSGIKAEAAFQAARLYVAQKKTAEAKKLLQRIIDRKAGVINDMGFIVWVTQCEQLMTAIENGDLPVKPAPAAKKSAPAKK